MDFARMFLSDLRLSRAPAAGFVTVGMFWGSFAGLVPDLKAAINASDGTFGITMLIASFGAFAAMWLAPRVDAKLGARALQASAFALALAFLLPGLAFEPVFFTVAMVLASAGSGCLDVIMNTRISSIEADAKRPLMNLNHALFSFAYAGAALATGVFREVGSGPATVFAVMFGVTVALLAVMHHPPAEISDDTSARKVKARAALIWFGGVIILIGFLAEQSTEAWSALHLERGLGGSAAQGALGPAILGLTMGVGRLSGQVIAGYVRATHALQIAAVIAAIGISVAASAQTLSLAYLGFAVLGLGVSIIAPMAYSAVGERVSNQERAAVITRISVIGYMGFFIGPPLMGGLSELFGLPVSFYTVAGILLLVSFYLAPGLRRQ